MVQRITIAALSLTFVGTMTAEAQGPWFGTNPANQAGISVFQVRDIEPPALEVWANADSEAGFMQDAAIALMLGRRVPSALALTGQDTDSASKRGMAEDAFGDGVFIGRPTDLQLRVPEDSGFDLVLHRAQEFTVERISATLAGVFRTVGGLNLTIIGTSGLGDRFLATPGSES